MALVQHVPLFSILLLMAAGILCSLMRKPTIAKNFTLTVLIVVLIMNVGLALFFINSDINSYNYSLGYYPAPWGNELKATVVEAILSVTFLGVGILSLLAGTRINKEMIPDSKREYYYLMVNILMSSLLALVYTNDLFTSYVFLEINTIGASALMVAKLDGESIRSTIKYFIMSAIGSTMFLLGIANLYALTGHLAMEPLHDSIIELLEIGSYNTSLTITLILLVVGLSVKSGLFPFHTWSPDSYSSATPSSSAILSGIVSKGYVFLAIKLIHRVFGMDALKTLNVTPIILTLGLLGMFSGSIFAIFQKDLRRMTAYSSVAQIGYIFTAMGIGTHYGVAAAIFHIIHHAITKSALFLTVGNMTHEAQTNDIKKLTGIGILMPTTMLLFTVAAFSMIGIPPSIGFNSKWYFVESILQSNYQWIVVLMSISTLLNAVYWLPIIFRGFFSEKAQTYYNEGRAFSMERTFSELYPTVILATLILIFAFGSRPLFNLIFEGLTYL